MREIHKKNTGFEWDANKHTKTGRLSLNASERVDSTFGGLTSADMSLNSAPIGANSTYVDAQTVPSNLQLALEDDWNESKIDLAFASNLIASSITDGQTFIDDWGFGEGVGSGDIGAASCGCGQCGSCTGGGSANGPGGLDGEGRANLDQVVFLDFDTGTDGNINYTPMMRDTVQSQMETIYERFGVEFVQTAPEAGEFSTLFFNRGSQGGLAEDIDFRNQNKSDNAVLNVTGLSSNPQAIISASAVIGAHELGHILGLRHHDAWGPIGSGVPEGLAFLYDPVYPGPQDADETRDHIMNTPALAGVFSDTFTQSWLGEREAIKLTYAAEGNVVFESTAPNDTFEDAQAIEFQELIVPNTIVQGENADAGDFLVKAISVVGSFGFVDPIDYFSFEGEVGRAYSIEVISLAPNRYSDNDPIDGVISIFDEDFNPVDYYGAIASNDNDVEFFAGDSSLVDLILPETGTYYAAVDTGSSGDTGTYELFINSFVASPFDLPEFDDHTDNLINTQATPLVFDPVGSNVVARDTGVVGFLDSPEERDVFKFTIESNAKLIVDVRATTDFFDTFAEIYNIDGVRVAFNDNNTNPAVPNENDSQIIIPDLSNGEYFVVVSGSNSTTGAYRLTVRHNGDVGGVDDHGDSFGSATVFPMAPFPDTTHVSGIAERGNDRDMFRFTANSTGSMVIRTKALSGDLNTVLRGYDADRNLLDANNNFNGSLNSRIVMNVTEGEDYFVRLSTVRETSGSYRISFRPSGSSSGGSGGSGFGFSDSHVNLNFNQEFTTLEDIGLEGFGGSERRSFCQMDYNSWFNGMIT